MATSKFFPFHYSSIILSFNVIQSELSAALATDYCCVVIYLPDRIHEY
jgi:hypothetical protein